MPPKKVEPFDIKQHNWNEKLYNSRTRLETLNYYLKIKYKLFKWIKNRPIMIWYSHGNKRIVRRYINNKPIIIKKVLGIDDKTSLEYHIYRRAVSFHLTIAARTKLVFIDIDYKRAELFDKKYIHVLKYMMNSALIKYHPRKYSVHKSPNGKHILVTLTKSISPTIARRLLIAEFNKYKKEESLPTNFLVGKTNATQVRIDLTTIKINGNIRSPYSL
jgi:hypothetical protein